MKYPGNCVQNGVKNAVWNSVSCVIRFPINVFVRGEVAEVVWDSVSTAINHSVWSSIWDTVNSVDKKE